MRCHFLQGIEPVSPALAGMLFTTMPLGKLSNHTVQLIIGNLSNTEILINFNFTSHHQLIKMAILPFVKTIYFTENE